MPERTGDTQCDGCSSMRRVRESSATVQDHVASIAASLTRVEQRDVHDLALAPQPHGEASYLPYRMHHAQCTVHNALHCASLLEVVHRWYCKVGRYCSGVLGHVHVLPDGGDNPRDWCRQRSCRAPSSGPSLTPEHPIPSPGRAEIVLYCPTAATSPPRTHSFIH
nr:hypothetical protein CFP56_64845 [Quercus suber]